MARLSLKITCAVLGCLIGLAGCNFSPAEPTPTVEVVATASPTATVATPAPLPPTVTPPEIALITPAHTPTPVTPSATPTITPTPGPFEHIVQEGDGLIDIVLQYDHYDLAVLDVVVAMNQNVSSADRLPPPGSMILIPRPTPSPTPIGGELTATIIAQNPPSPTPLVLTDIHTVEEGQTAIGIALQYNTTMAILAELNPSYYWFGCDFSIASGGTDCNPPLSIGDEFLVPLPTLTPTLSPTPSGHETPTLTPMPGVVRLLWPAPGSIIAGGPLTLRWIAPGALASDELYQVTVTDTTTGMVYTDFTRNNTLTLPAELQPSDDAIHAVTWQVFVVRIGDDNVAFRVGALGEERPFQWTMSQ